MSIGMFSEFSLGPHKSDDVVQHRTFTTDQKQFGIQDNDSQYLLPREDSSHLIW